MQKLKMKGHNLLVDAKKFRESSEDIAISPAFINNVKSVKTDKMSLFQITLDIGFMSGAIPYCIKYDKKSQGFIIHKSKLQMVYCLLFQGMTMLSQINHIRILDLTMVKQDPTIYFQLCRRFTLLITISAWHRSTWANSNELKTFISMTHSTLTGNYRKIASRMIKTVCLIYVTIGMVGSVLIIETTHWDLHSLYNAYLNISKRTFPLEVGSEDSITQGPHPQQDNQADGIFIQNTLVLIQVLLAYCHDASVWVMYLFMMSIVITMWFSVRIFQDRIQSDDTSDPNTICRHFNALKTMSNCASSVFGFSLLSWICYIVPFSALRISEMFVVSTSDWLLLLFLCIYFAHLVVFLTLAADFCSRVETMKQWLLQNEIMKHFDAKTHNALLADLAANPVALRSYGVFTLTYGLIGNLFTLMTSFFIIITQFKMASSTPVAL